MLVSFTIQTVANLLPDTVPSIKRARIWPTDSPNLPLASLTDNCAIVGIIPGLSRVPLLVKEVTDAPR